MKSVTADQLAAMRETYLADTKARVVRNALTKNDLSSVSRVFDAEAANPNLFSIDLKTMPVTNQQASGRCWIFSAMNVLREKIAANYEIKEFELSQNYIAFYDKLEKANWFMECVLAEADAPLNSENNRFLLETAVGDGGQWNMLVSLVKNNELHSQQTSAQICGGYQKGEHGRKKRIEGRMSERGLRSDRFMLRSAAGLIHI